MVNLSTNIKNSKNIVILLILTLLVIGPSLNYDKPLIEQATGEIVWSDVIGESDSTFKPVDVQITPTSIFATSATTADGGMVFVFDHSGNEITNFTHSSISGTSIQGIYHNGTHIFVSERSLNLVSIFDTSYQFQDQITTNLEIPKDIYVNSTHIFVSESGGIKIFDLAGNYQDFISAVVRNIYVNDTHIHAIVDDGGWKLAIYELNGDFVLYKDGIAASPSSGTPWGITLTDELIYLSTGGTDDLIAAYDYSYQYQFDFGFVGSGDEMFSTTEVEMDNNQTHIVARDLERLVIMEIIPSVITTTETKTVTETISYTTTVTETLPPETVTETINDTTTITGSTETVSGTENVTITFEEYRTETTQLTNTVDITNVKSEAPYPGVIFFGLNLFLIIMVIRRSKK